MTRRLVFLVAVAFILMLGQTAPLSASPLRQGGLPTVPVAATLTPPGGATLTPAATTTATTTATASRTATPEKSATPTDPPPPTNSPAPSPTPAPCPYPFGPSGYTYVWVSRQPGGPPQKDFPAGTVTVYVNMCYNSVNGSLPYTVEIVDSNNRPLAARAGTHPGTGITTASTPIDIPLFPTPNLQPYYARLTLPSLFPGPFWTWEWTVGTSVNFDRGQYQGTDDVARLTVFDALVAGDDSVSVSVTSETPGGRPLDSRTFTLMANPRGSGRFEGSFTFRTADMPPTFGALVVADGAVLTARYERSGQINPAVSSVATWSVPPTPTPSPTRTASPTSTPTPTVTLTPTVTQTPTITQTPTRTNTPLPGPTATPTPTFTVTQTYTPSPTSSPTAVPTWTPQAGVVTVTPRADQAGFYSQLAGANFPSPVWAGIWADGSNLHHGVVQFDLPPLPPGAQILGASVTLWGRQSYLDATAPVSWTLGLLPSRTTKFDETQPLTSASFDDIHAMRPSLATPAYDSSQLAVGTSNVFQLTQAQLVGELPVRYATTGRVTFRLDGPQTGSYNLFSWCGVSSYAAGSACNLAQRPLLTIRYGIPAPTFTPTFTPTPTRTATPTSTFTPTPTATWTPTWTLTPTNTASPTVTLTATATATATATLPPSLTPTATWTLTPSPTTTRTATATLSPTPTPTPTPGFVFVGHEPYRTYHTLADELWIEVIDPSPSPFQSQVYIFSDATAPGAGIFVNLSPSAGDPTRLQMSHVVRFCVDCAATDPAQFLLKVRDGGRIFVDYDNYSTGSARWFTGTATPTPSRTTAPTETQTPTQTATPPPTLTPTTTTTPSPTATLTPTSTRTATATATSTATPTITPTPVPTFDFYFDQRGGAYIGLDTQAVLTLYDEDIPIYCEIGLFPSEVTARVSSTTSPYAFQVTLKPFAPCSTVYTSRTLDHNDNVTFCVTCEVSDPQRHVLKVSDGDEVWAEYLDRLRPGVVHVARARWHAVPPTVTPTPTRTHTPTPGPTATVTPTPTATEPPPPTVTPTPTPPQDVTVTPTPTKVINYRYSVFLPLVTNGGE